MIPNKNKDSFLGLLIRGVILLLMMYLAIAWMAFQWRNPKSNEMSFWRHLPSVLTFEKLDQYQ